MLVSARHAKFCLFSFLLVIAALAGSRARADDDGKSLHRPFDRIVVFGTSLSDPGNAFGLSGCHITAPDYNMQPEDLLVPEGDCPYARGGHHFSNGPTWIESLAIPLGLGHDVRPALAGSNGGASNYANGGATALPLSRYHLGVQVETFLRDFGGSAPANALYVVEMGANDVQAALRTGNQQLIPQAIGSIAAHMQLLYAAGARKFLVWNVPNLAATPAVRMLAMATPGVPVLDFAYAASSGFREGLDMALAQLSALPGIEIVRFDAFTEINRIVAQPSAYGLGDVANACIMPGVPPYQCREPDRHLFWDGIHPTRAAHAITAMLAGKALLQGLVAADQ